METKEEFWALKDVSFEVKKGEVIGIIGRNGAGKSTLLKILSQITPPTHGEIKLHGKVGSLLEVGTGFHPELSGRENIFLNGAILGMSQKEIGEKFDTIVEFAGIEKFLDTPVKYYSSGMYVRLAFSVAAHMEPDILIIDEVLAVGDAEFQKKCLGKMGEISKEGGRTVLFVSHNISAIQNLCQKCIVLEKGQIKSFKETSEAIQDYINLSSNKSESVSSYEEDPSKKHQITKISFLNKNNDPSNFIPVDENFSIEIEYLIKEPLPKALICVLFYGVSGELILHSSETDGSPCLKDYQPGVYKTTIEVPKNLLNINQYYIEVSLQKPFVEYVDLKKNLSFEITDANNYRLDYRWKKMGKLSSILNYKTIKTK
ncbi:MAG: ABC transporter ATP-binding protein [bacterium]